MGIKEGAQGPLNLFTELELIEHFLVVFFVLRLQVLKVSAAFPYQLEQALARVKIVLVTLQVLGELIDTSGENGSLHLCTSGVLVVLGKLFNNFFLVVAFHSF